MKMKNEDKVLIGAGVLGAGILGWMWWKKRKSTTENQAMETNNTPLATLPVNTKPKVSTVINTSKILGYGSKGLEVRELQKLLGFTGSDIDGDFGNKTLEALQNQRSVSKISVFVFRLKTMPTPATKPKPTAYALPKLGQKLMAIINNTSIWNAQKLADGKYSNTNIRPLLQLPFDYGENIGTFINANTNGKYLINREGVYYFVNRENVKAY